MKRHNGLVLLSRDHHHGLIAAQFCKKNSPGYKKMPNDPEGKRKYILDYGEKELLDHFKIEEEILIPSISGKDPHLDELSKIVLHNHEAIKHIIRELEAAADVESALDNFGKAVDNHIRFEEREWFQNIQKTISERKLSEIGRLINGGRPEDKKTNF